MATKRKNTTLEVRETKKNRSVEQTIEDLSPSDEPIHKKRYMIRAELNWRVNNHEERIKGKFLLDSGCTGPILNSQLTDKTTIPLKRRQSQARIDHGGGLPMEDAGLHYAPNLQMVIGKHLEELSWEIGRLEDGVLGYLPVAWLIEHNPDIDWKYGTMKWRSAHCKAHCLPTEVKVDWTPIEDLVVEGTLMGIATVTWHDEDGGDISAQLPERYKAW